MKKNNDIEVLRAVGIIFVMISHLPTFMPWAPSWQSVLFNHTYFWSGVDLFFAVSGFVIMKSISSWILNDKNDKYISDTILFWTRRFYRLIPASWLFLLLTFLASIFYNKTGTLGQPDNNFIDALTQFFYLSNWRVYYCNINQASCGLNAHYWSLSLEEQFYFILPIMIFLFRKKVIFAFIAIIIIQFPLDRVIGGWLWLNRIDSMMWGCLIAMLSESKYYSMCKPDSLKNPIMRWLVCGILLASLAYFARGEMFSFHMGVVALVSGAMVWISSYGEGLLFGRLSRNLVVLWIASRSYSIYLAHPLSFILIMEYCKQTRGQLSSSDTFTILFFGSVLTIILSELSYRFIETPFRLKGKKFVSDKQ